jgi:hypothetical protein
MILPMESRPNQHRPTPDQRGVPEPGQQRPGNNKDRGYRRAGRRTRLRSSGRRERDERRVFELERRQEMFDAEVTTIYHMDMGERGESLHEPTIAEPAGDSAQNETDIQNPQSPITTQADRKAERADRKAAREKKKNKKDGKKEQKQSNLEKHIKELVWLKHIWSTTLMTLLVLLNYAVKEQKLQNQDHYLIPTPLLKGKSNIGSS